MYLQINHKLIKLFKLIFIQISQLFLSNKHFIHRFKIINFLINRKIK